MPNIEQFHGCCGVYELEDLTDNPIDSLKEVYETGWEGYDERPTFIVFTDAIRGYAMTGMKGRTLELYIKANKLGEIIRTKPKKNIKSGNMLYVWVWTIDIKKLEKWYKKQNDN